jgi:5-formyltetrahydrofolate cyclo-ligase
MIAVWEISVTGTDDIAAEKKRLRKRILAGRKAAANASRAAGAMRNSLSLLPGDVGMSVALYAGFGSELDPMPLVRQLWRQGIEVGLPVVVENGQPLVFRRYSPAVRYVLSSYGIREPEERTPEVLPDLVFAPLVGIDRRGVRLGYGGGFYDRTLAAWRGMGYRPPVFGLAFECQLVSRLPRGPYDILLDGLVTEAGVRRFR